MKTCSCGSFPTVRFLFPPAGCEMVREEGTTFRVSGGVHPKHSKVCCLCCHIWSVWASFPLKKGTVPSYPTFGWYNFERKKLPSDTSPVPPNSFHLLPSSARGSADVATRTTRTTRTTRRGMCKRPIRPAFSSVAEGGEMRVRPRTRCCAQPIPHGVGEQTVKKI